MLGGSRQRHRGVSGGVSGEGSASTSAKSRPPLRAWPEHRGSKKEHVSAWGSVSLDAGPALEGGCLESSLLHCREPKGDGSGFRGWSPSCPGQAPRSQASLHTHTPATALQVPGRFPRPLHLQCLCSPGSCRDRASLVCFPCPPFWPPRASFSRVPHSVLLSLTSSPTSWTRVRSRCVPVSVLPASLHV